MEIAMMIGQMSCTQIGRSQVILFDKFREPRTAPLAVIAPVHLDVEMMSITSSRV